MTSTKKGLFEQAKKFVDELKNNQGKANKIIDNLGVKQSDKAVMKELLNKSGGHIDVNDQNQIVKLIKSLIAQGGNDPDKRKKAAETIKKLNLAGKLNPANRKMLDEIMKMLEK